MNALSPDIPSGRRAGARTPSVMFILPGLGAGGSEHVVTFVSNRLASEGYRVNVVSFESPDSKPYYTLDPRIGVEYLGVPVGRRGAVQALKDMRERIARLRRIYQASKPDLVISLLTRCNVVAVLAGRGLGIPIIVSERNNPLRQYHGKVWSALRRLTYPKAHGLLTMTRGAMECFPAAMRRRSWVIPNMADFQEFTPTYANEPKVMTAVGRLTDQKGFDILLRAWARIAQTRPGWILRIWGEGPDRASLEALRKALGVEGSVDMPGVSSEPGNWIVGADAFVLSSRYEGWGLVLGEAMAAGLPCVSFDCPFGPADMITDGSNALLAPDGDEIALGDRMAELMDDADLRICLGRAAKDSSLRFAPERIGDQWKAMIDSVLLEQGALPGSVEVNAHDA